MPASPPLPTRPLPALAAGVWLLLAGIVGAQGVPPPDGILDETRALTAESHRLLAEELGQFRAGMKCEAWITAASFMPAGVSVRRHAQATRRAWGGERPAVLMAYDRATNGGGLSFSPWFWQRYSAAELVEVMQETSRMLVDDTLTLDERMVAATRLWMDRLRAMESVRLRQSLIIQQDEKRLALLAAAVLGGLACVAAVLGLWARRRHASAEHRFHFPAVQVAMRFGAPYGGGVVAEFKPGPGP